MIKANELRIGDWVKIDTSKSGDYYEDYSTPEFQIRGFNDGGNRNGSKLICHYHIACISGGLVTSGAYDLDLLPIPLTHDWLIKFGFEYIDYRDKYQIKTFPFQLADEENGEYVLLHGFRIEEAQTIKFVHQLQNLYFALTGEELQIVK